MTGTTYGSKIPTRSDDDTAWVTARAEAGTDGEYSLTVTCTGDDSKIHVIVVGGLERTWEF